MNLIENYCSDQFIQLSNEIGYHFKDINLLKQSLTHPSISSTKNYERLEFLGDSIINMLVSELLLNLFPLDNEGNLSKKRVNLVCQYQLVEIAGLVNLNTYILMSDAEKKTGGPEKKSILENALEALTAAIYLDGGISVAKLFVWNYWKPFAEKMVSVPQNPKSELQEWLQSRNLPLPSYTMIAKNGDEHNPTFTIKACALNYGAGIGTGSTKKIAQQLAAENLLKKLLGKIDS